LVIGRRSATRRRCSYIGEKVGSAIGKGPKIDIALESGSRGTTITGQAGPNASRCWRFAEQGGLLNAPDVYMDKDRGRPGLSRRRDRPRQVADENVSAVAAAKGVAPADIIALRARSPAPREADRRAAAAIAAASC